MDQEYIVIPGVRYTCYEYIKPDNSNKVFIKDCENRDLNALKKQYHLNEIEQSDIYEAFQTCLTNELLHVLKWLYSSGKFDVHYEEDFFFIVSCQDNDLEVTKWLYSLDSYDQDTFYVAFRGSCHYAPI